MTTNLKFSGLGSLLTNYTDLTDDSISVSVNVRENKINDAVLVSNDDAGKTYLTNIQIGDMVTIDFEYLDDGIENWKEVIRGIVVGKEPVMDTENGSICRVQLYAYPAIALNRMRVMGAYSLDPDNLDTLIDIFAGKNNFDVTEFPNFEYYTETCTLNNASTFGSVIGDWAKNSTAYAAIMSMETSGGATNDSTNFVGLLGGAAGTTGDYVLNYPQSSVHGFPLFIDQFSNPQYDASQGTWKNIPYLTFYVKRDNMDSWLDLQLWRSSDDYLEFEFDKTYVQDGEAFHLIDDDNEWHKIQIPVGRHWNKAPILLDGESTVQSFMNANYIGDPLNRWFGWNVRSSGEATGGSSGGSGPDENGTKGGSWNDILAINFHFYGVGVTATQYYIDLLTIGVLNKQFGIIPCYVNKYFNYEDSGYDITTNGIVNDLQEVPFSKFIYEPVTKCLQDSLNLLAGKNWLHNQTVGKHWIMINNMLCIAPVNDHSGFGPKILLTEDGLLNEDHIHVSTVDIQSFKAGMKVTVGDDIWSEIKTIDTVDEDGTITFTEILDSSYPLSLHGYVNFAINEVWSLASKYTEQQPLVVGEDIIRNNFRTYESEANFIIVNGLFENPPNNDWTNTRPENHVIINGAYNEYGGATLTDIIDVGTGLYQAQWRISHAPYGQHTETRVDRVHNGIIGPTALKFNVLTDIIGAGAPLQALLVFADPQGIFNDTNYPIEFNNAIDLNLLQNPELTFWIINRDVGPAASKFKIKIFTDTFFNAITTSTYFGDGDGNYFEKEVNVGTATDDIWKKMNIKIGEGSTGWVAHGDAAWSKPIICILFYAVQNYSSGEWFILDGVNISGSTIRIAKSTSAIEKQGGIKTKLVNELLIRGYSNSMQVYDNLDQLAVAECLRAIGMSQTVESVANNEAVSINDCENLGANPDWVWSGDTSELALNAVDTPNGTNHHLATITTDSFWFATPSENVTVSTNDVRIKLWVKVHAIQTTTGVVIIAFHMNNCTIGIEIKSNNGIDGKCYPYINGSISVIPYDLTHDQWYELSLHLYKVGPDYKVDLYDNEILRGTAVSQSPIGDTTLFNYMYWQVEGDCTFHYDYLRVFGPEVTISTERVPITTGSVIIPYDPDLLGGQQIWIKSPSFSNVPKCFRLLYATDTCNTSEGALSRLYLTDDLSNSYATDPTDLANISIKTVNPDFQTRTYTRLALGSIAWNGVLSKIIDVDTL